MINPMIRIVFLVLSAEVVVVVALLFKTPFRKLVILGLDRLKRGRGPNMVKVVVCIMVAFLSSSLYSMAQIRSRSEKAGALTPIDQVLMNDYLLGASLMGYSLLLALIIDRLHHYVRELRALRKNMEVVMKQNKGLEEAKSGDEIKSRDTLASLNEQIKQLKLELEERINAAKAVNVKVEALKKQNEDLLLKYDRILEDNQSLRNLLQSIEQPLSHPESMKIS
ncbi:B-cell receptor-associated protein 31-like [Canna indica]|uniref:Endoplasmic reticulum transmembrane protein n=1 Tax=Canna indica TaxID=4628 RepID=A0AAQ3KW61_9LILI|nr:B-cell receptor-associated protein 31-like [Canna indica]